MSRREGIRMPYNFHLKQIQTVLFTPGINLTDSISVVSALTSAVRGLFNRQPAILPIPSDAPAEIPRIVLKNANESYVCNVTKDGVSLIFDAKESVCNLLDSQDEYLNHLLSIAGQVKDTIKAQINRIGVILVSVLPLQESSNSFISHHFLNESLFMNTSDIVLHILKHEDIKGYKTNCWFKVQTLHNEKNPSDDRAMLVTFDVNTIPTGSNDLNKDQVGIFFNAALEYVQSSIKVYFIE